MPWIIEDTAEPKGENFIRKAPGNHLMHVKHEHATVYRTLELAAKEAGDHEEWFMTASGERISEEEWWALKNQNDANYRQSTTLVLHEIDFFFLKSEKFSS